MSCGLKSEWLDRLIKLSTTPMESHMYSDGKSAHSDGKPAATPMETHTHSDGKLLLTSHDRFLVCLVAKKAGGIWWGSV
jgi:hypothetical protein